MQLRSKVFYTYTLFVILYLLLVLFPAPLRATLIKYHISPLGLRLLDATLLIPIFVMWYAIFYGYSELHQYSRLIKPDRDGKQVARLAKGLLVLAIGLPLSSIISTIFALYTRSHTSATGSSVIVMNYIGILYPLIAFIFINAGARGLNSFTRNRPSALLSHIVTLTVAILGVVFCDLIAHAHSSLRTTYHLTYGTVLLTLAIPYIYMWFIGFLAVIEMYAYSKQVAGVFYRRGWNRLTLGLGTIIVLNIILQYLQTLSTWLNGLSLSGVLVVLYVLLLFLAAGFIVVALGTKELMKIEEA